MATKYATPASIAHQPIKYSTSLLMKLWLTMYPNYFLHTCTNCLSIINTEKILINLSRICTLSTISPPKSQSLFSQSRPAYECNSPSIRNDRKLIARHSLVFVSIRGRSCGVANIMLVSHSGEYMANGLTNAICHQFAMIAN